MKRHVRLACALAGLLAWGAAAHAALPKPTPAQQQEAAAKKAAADAKAAKDKEALTASMDALSNRWRSQAPSKGWKINPPVTVAAAPAAASPVPRGVTPPNAGMPAAAPANAAPGTAAAAPATGAAPLSRQALNAANVPIKSEKLGTAAPSEDVKQAQTRSVPKGAAPALDKKSTPTTANKQ